MIREGAIFLGLNGASFSQIGSIGVEALRLRTKDLDSLGQEWIFMKELTSVL